MARPFRRLQGVPKGTDEYAILHDRRPFVFSVTTKDGGTAEYAGSVLIEDVDRLMEMFEEVLQLANK